MAELGPVNPILVKAGYRRPSLQEYVKAGYKAESYVPYFEKFEEGLIPDVEAGDVTFNTEHLEADTEPPKGLSFANIEQEPIDRSKAPALKPQKSPPEKVVEPPKPKRPSFAYPGYHEPD